MKISQFAVTAVIAVACANTALAVEEKVWATILFDTPQGLAVSTLNAESETVNALAAQYDIMDITIGHEPASTPAGIKHIVLDSGKAGKASPKGSGPNALNDCTSFASNPGTPFQIDNSNLPFNEDFNVTPLTDDEDWRGLCVDGISTGDGKEAFVQFTPTATGQYLIEGNFFQDAAPTTPRTSTVTVWELPGCTATQPTAGASSQVGCHFDLFGNSQAVVSLTSGTVYYVILEDQFGSSAEDTAQIRISGPLAAPAGQDCANAIDLTSESWTSGFNVLADSTPNPDQGDSTASCNSAANAGPDVWFALPAVVNGEEYELDLTAGSLTDSFVTLYSGSCGSLAEVDCNDDKNGTDSMSAITFTAVGGQDYYLQVESWSFSGADRGTFTLNGQVAPVSSGISEWTSYH